MKTSRAFPMIGTFLLLFSNHWNFSAAAELARPSAVQYAWHEQERIQFVCLDPCTWQGREYDNHTTRLSDMKLEKLDVEQWLDAADRWGAREILLVCKHTGGFCWWPTATTDYSVKGIPWKNGKGNLVKDLADACRRRGLTMGLYVYPDDPRFMKGIGRGGKTDDPAKQEEWSRLFRTQWEEVLTICGTDIVSEIWFDGGCQIPMGDIFDRLAPNAILFNVDHPTREVRWVGNEAGIAPDPDWNPIGGPDGRVWAPVECDTTLYDHYWFWAAANERRRKSNDHLMNLFVQSVGRGSVLLLNSTPNTDGLIPDGDMIRYREFGGALKRNFEHPRGVVGNTRGETVEIDLGKPTRINCADLWEDYRDGHRIRAYVVEGRVGGAWTTLSAGTSVGRRKIDLFAPVLADRVRLRITSSVAEPAVRRFQVHCADDSLARAHEQPLSRGCPASASSCYSDAYAARLLFDGDSSTRWNAAETDPEPWVEVDLGRPRKIARATANEAADRIRQFRIEVRNNTNESWRVAHEGGRMGGAWKADFARTTARFVRLHILSSTNHPAAPTISELNLFDRPDAREVVGTWAGAAAVCDLSVVVNEPGRYDVQFVDAAGSPVVIGAASLQLDGSEAAKDLEGVGTDKLTIHRTQVVTAETTTKLRATLRCESAAKGEIRIRPAN